MKFSIRPRNGTQRIRDRRDNARTSPVATHEHLGKQEPKDLWDRLDIIGKLLVPMAVVFLTFWLNLGQNERQIQRESLDLAIRILGDEEYKERSEKLSNWANAYVHDALNLTEDLKVEIREQGLPQKEPSLVPATSQGRTSVVLMDGNSPSETSIKEIMTRIGHADATVRSQSIEFPDKSELRYYFAQDELRAKALQTALQKELNILIPLNESFGRSATHRAGDLNVYLRSQ